MVVLLPSCKTHLKAGMTNKNTHTHTHAQKQPRVRQMCQPLSRQVAGFSPECTFVQPNPGDPGSDAGFNQRLKMAGRESKQTAQMANTQQHPGAVFRNTDARMERLQHWKPVPLQDQAKGQDSDPKILTQHVAHKQGALFTVAPFDGYISFGFPIRSEHIVAIGKNRTSASTDLGTGVRQRRRNVAWKGNKKPNVTFRSKGLNNQNDMWGLKPKSVLIL